MGRITGCADPQRDLLRLFRLRLHDAANASRHGKAADGVVVRNGRVDVDFRLVDAVVTDEGVDDPPDVPGAPHIT
ncbi:MAG TPA: hypothetical protein VHU80_00685 [Polyangiaceae bacterium]|jgi:hypothetical protein|nr:hypothetical protein [Polyangiaceae bacterium]